MRVGEVINAKSISVVYFGQETNLRRLTEVWRTKKGYTYVLAVLAVEEDGKTINVEQKMNEMGWTRVEPKLCSHCGWPGQKFDSSVGRTL